MLRKIVYALLLLFTINSSQANPVVGLEDIVRSVLNSNLEIDKQQILVDQSNAIAQQVSAEFDWNLAAEGGVKRPRVPGTSPEGYLTNETEFNYVSKIAVGMEKQFRNGITIAPGGSYSQNLNDNRSEVLADSVTAPSIAVTIPLLRGRGTEVTTANEQAAKETQKASELIRDRATAKIIVNATHQYWQSVAAKRNLEAEQKAGDEAAAITETLKKLSEQGELSILEYQSSVANLNLRRLKIEKSAVTWNSTRRKLARLMESGHRIKILPVSDDQFPNFGVETDLILDENVLIDIAFEQRRDLLALQRKVQSKRLNLVKSRNDMQPQLDLNLDLDKITLSYAQSLGRNLSKGRKRASTAELKTQEIELQMLKQAISDEVYETVENLQLSFKSYKRAHKAYRLLDQIANTTRDKVAQGTAARNEYLSALDKLSEVEQMINAASVDYATALAKLRLATGTLPVSSEKLQETLKKLLTVPTNG